MRKVRHAEGDVAVVSFMSQYEASRKKHVEQTLFNMKPITLYIPTNARLHLDCYIAFKAAKAIKILLNPENKMILKILCDHSTKMTSFRILCKCFTEIMISLLFSVLLQNLICFCMMDTQYSNNVT